MAGAMAMTVAMALALALAMAKKQEKTMEHKIMLTAKEVSQALAKNSALTLLHSIDSNVARYPHRAKKLFDMNFEAMTTVLKLEAADG